MAITVDWLNRIILVLRLDMAVVQAVPERRALDLNAFRLELKEIEGSEEGMPFVDMHRHNTPVVLAGVTYARSVEIINNFTVEFEDGQYGVVATGANSNVFDVVIDNQVAFLGNNSAGLIETAVSGLTAGEALSLELILKMIRNRRETNPGTGKQRIYDDDSVTVLIEGDLFEDVAGLQPYRGQGADRADRMT